MPDVQKYKICLSAGGTGGHLFPAEALAAELRSRGHDVMIVTDKRGKAFQSLDDGVAVYTVRAATLKPGIVSKLRAVVNMIIGVVQALCLLRRQKPQIVIGFGGYPCVPAVLAAQLLGIPTALHEQNAVLGKANHFLAKRATVIAASFPDTKNAPSDRTVVTGNPVRGDILAVRDTPYPSTEGKLTVLITGGSQGARILSQVIPAAIKLLSSAHRDKMHIIQQARPEDLQAVQDAYQALGVSCDIASFFGDMAGKLAASHVFIGRSGASTVTEIAAVGRPAIFIPLFHADRQQYHNANVLAETGGAWIMEQADFTPDALAEKLRELIEKPDKLVQAAKASYICGQTQGAVKLADLVEQKAKI